MSSVKEEYSQDYLLLGFGFRYVRGVTDENDVIKGSNFYAFGKKLVTIAVSNTDWVDENGVPYKFKLDGNILFAKKLAIGFL